MRDPMRQRAGLARTGAGNHEEGPAWSSTYLFNAVPYGAALFRVQPFEMGKRHWSRIAGAGRLPNHDSCFVRNRASHAGSWLAGPSTSNCVPAGFFGSRVDREDVPVTGRSRWVWRSRCRIGRDARLCSWGSRLDLKIRGVVLDPKAHARWAIWCRFGRGGRLRVSDGALNP